MDLNKYTITQDDLHDLYILDKHQIILYTYGSGDILKFQINGKSKLIQSIFQLYYEQIQFIGDIGWICGENGAFYQTNDRGNFWNFKPISHNTLDDNDRL
ncbi:MAG: hypothetical protein OEY49_19340, partial [Candidatus Heimdallarchaeota archaeon]|nr:hypothetical protein [Candidatus Heimdallarchaeota archaeon]